MKTPLTGDGRLNVWSGRGTRGIMSARRGTRDEGQGDKDRLDRQPHCAERKRQHEIVLGPNRDEA